jgi:hypothetical protein
VRTTIVLTLLALLLGAGGGFAGGFAYAVVDKVHTDTELGCAVLQTAESAGYLTHEQRGQLVDLVVPPRDTTRPNADWIRQFADAWWDSIREDQKSGCPNM